MSAAILNVTFEHKPQLITLILNCLREQGVFPRALALVPIDTRRLIGAIVSGHLQADLPRHSPESGFHLFQLTSDVGLLASPTILDEVARAFPVLYTRMPETEMAGNSIQARQVNPS